MSFQLSYISFSDDEFEVNTTTREINKAIFDDDVGKLAELVDRGYSINCTISLTDDTPLHSVLHRAFITNKRESCFDFLVNHKDTNLDARNYSGWTPLHYAVKIHDPYYALSLIRKGADVNLTVYVCKTPLTLATNILVAQELVLKGANVNHQDEFKFTRIFREIMKERFDRYFFDCLLFYGGDVTIPNSHNELSFFECPHPEIEETLFNLTFDSLECYKVKMRDFYKLIKRESPYFYQMLDLCSAVDCNTYYHWEWDYFDTDQKLRMLHSLLSKFKDVAYKMMCEDNPLRKVPYNLPKVVFTLDETYASKIMFKNYMESSYNLDYLLMIHKSMEFILYLLSKGLQLTPRELDIIYTAQGFSEFFEILLHVELLPVEWYNYTRHMHDLNYKMSKNNRLIKFFYASEGVPSLMELSREVARRHLVSSYGIKNSGIFLAVLKCLPIPKIIQDVLCYKQALY